MAKDPSRHYETPDPNPVSIPSGFKRPETLQEQIARLVKTRISAEAQAAGFETFEEADDFDIEDDMPDPSTPYEPFFDPALGREITPADVIRHKDQYGSETERRHAATMARKRAKEAKAAPPATPLADPPPATPQEPKKQAP